MNKQLPPAFIFVSPVTFSVVKETQLLLPAPPEALILRPRSVLEALSGFDQSGRAVIVVTASDAKHIKIAVTLASRLKSPIKEGLVKIIILSEMQHADLPKFLKKHGCEELVSPEIKPKALKLKLLRLMTLIELSWEKTSQTSEVVEAAENDSTPSGPRKKGSAQVKATEALQVEDDCWIIRGKAFKFTQDTWTLRVHGPSPLNGRWARDETLSDTWIWTPKEPANDPFVSRGVWTFYGQEPSNRDRAWNFAGAEARLTYSRDGKEICHRFETDREGTLQVARNSRAALKKSDLINHSYEKASLSPIADSSTVVSARESPAPTIDWSSQDLNFGEEATDLPEEVTEDLAIGPPAPAFAKGKFGTKTVLEIERLDFYEEILEELGPRPEMFSVISSRKACLAIMKESAHLRAPAILWTRGQKFRTTAQVSHFADASGSLGMELSNLYDWPRLMAALQEVEAQEIFVNANLGRTAVFFKQPLSELRGGATAVEVACPEKMYEVQRRRHIRHKLRENEDSRAVIETEAGAIHPWKLIDISAGGVAVCITRAPTSLLAQLTQGTSLASIRFTIYGQEIESGAQIAWMKNSPSIGAAGGNDITLGLQFEHISQADREGIRLYVMEENFEYLKNVMPRTEE